MDFVFDLQRFGGGGTTTTQERNIPDQTPNESEMENMLMAYSRQGLSTAEIMQKLGISSLSNTYNPNWEKLLNNYTSNGQAIQNAFASNTSGITDAYGRDMLGLNAATAQNLNNSLSDYTTSRNNTFNNYQSNLNSNMDWLRSATSSNLNTLGQNLSNIYNAFGTNTDNSVNSLGSTLQSGLNNFVNGSNSWFNNYGTQSSNNLNEYRANTYNNLNRFDANASNALRNNLNATSAAKSAYDTSMKNAEAEDRAYQAASLNRYSSIMDALESKYNAGMDKINPLYEDLANGILPEAYATNRQAALNADLRGTVGNAINSMANRGIINSSVTNRGLDDIAQASSDTLYKNYQTDLALEAQMLNNLKGTIQDQYDTNKTAADTRYGNEKAYSTDRFNKATSTATGLKDTALNVAASDFANSLNTYTNQFNNANTVYGNNFNNWQGINNTMLSSGLGYENNRFNNTYNAATALQNARAQAERDKWQYGFNTSTGLYDRTYAANNNIWDKNYQTANAINAAAIDVANSIDDRNYRNTIANHNNYATAAKNYADMSNTNSLNLANIATNNNNNNFQNALSAQAASYTPANNYLSAASQLASTGQNLYNQMYSGRMGTGTVTTTQGGNDSGVWSAMGTLGSAVIMCFVGETLVTTPDGYKYIKDIKEGDTVLSLHDGEVVPKTVTEITGPHKARLVTVQWDNGTVWRTTDSQRYFDGKHFADIANKQGSAVTHNGRPTKVLSMWGTDITEDVYDFTVEGFAGENVFFANDVAAEGYGD